MNILKFLFGKVRRVNISGETFQKIDQDWQHIQTLLFGKSPSQLRQALILADKSLDNALKDLVAGETMGERLKNAKSLFDALLYDKLWSAHRCRNALVHEAGFDPPHYVVTKAVEDLRKGLRALRVNV